jgi:hypothetical protein
VAEKDKKQEEKVAMGSFNYYSTTLDDFERPSLTDVLKPRDRKKAIEKAKEYVWTNGLLFRIIKLKVDLASAGLEPVHESKKIEQIYKDAYEKIDIHKFVKDFVYEYEVVGEVFPYRTWDDGELKSLSLLNPKLAEVDIVFDKDMIYMKAPDSIKKLLNNYSKLSAKQKKDLRDRVPSGVLKEWKKGKNVLLSEDNISRYCNLKSSYEKRPKPPISPIFNDLEIYKTLQDADYATAKKLKQLLLHIKVGGKDYNNGKAVNKKLIDSTMEMFNNPSKNFEVFTQYFVNAEYITPDMDIFSEEKYKNVISNIVNWSGVNVMVEQGGSYSQGYIKVKGLKQAVNNAREVVRMALNDLNKQIAEKNNLTYYGKLKLPTIKFSNNALTDDEEVRQFVQFLYKHGLLSAEDTLDAFDYSLDRQMRKKKGEEEFEDLIRIPFEPSQGLLEENKNQNKSDNGNPQDNKQPRP